MFHSPTIRNNAHAPIHCFPDLHHQTFAPAEARLLASFARRKSALPFLPRCRTTDTLTPLCNSPASNTLSNKSTNHGDSSHHAQDCPEVASITTGSAGTSFVVNRPLIYTVRTMSPSSWDTCTRQRTTVPHVLTINRVMLPLIAVVLTRSAPLEIKGLKEEPYTVE